MSENGKIREGLLAPDDWCLLAQDEPNWTILDLRGREPWQLLPVHPREPRTRRRIELVE
jgi:hypothetical protein